QALDGKECKLSRVEVAAPGIQADDERRRLLDGASELTGRELDPESAACEVAMPAVEDLALVERNRDLQALVPDVLEQRRGLGVGHGWEGRRNRMSRIGDGLRGGGRPRTVSVEPRGGSRDLWDF